MSREIINVGTNPNDGTGDPIRTAYIKTNNNFGELYARVQTDPPATLIGTVGDVAGMYAYSPAFFYYCFADYDGSTVIWAEISPTGNITVGEIANGDSNVVVPVANGAITMGVDGAANVMVVGKQSTDITGNLTVTGNVTGGYILGNGKFLSGLPETYSNANVANYLPVYSGNISGGNLNLVGNVSGAYILGNGSLLSGLPETYSNANVANYLPVYTGNITGSNIDGLFIGTISTGSQANIVQLGTLTSLTVSGNAAVGNVNASAVNATGNATVGNLSANAQITATGNVSAGNLVSLGNITATSTITATGNITGGNVTTAGKVTATGNITTLGYFVGNFAGNITGNLSVPGLTTYILYNQAGNAGAVPEFTFDPTVNLFTVLGNANIQNSIIAGSVTSNTSIDTVTVTATGNVTGGNFFTAGVVAATGNVSGGNMRSNGLIYATGNLRGANIISTGKIDSTGNVTAPYFFGNGSQLTGVTAGAAGSNTQIQYNTNGLIVGSPNLTFNGSNVNVEGNVIMGLGNSSVGLRSLTIGNIVLSENGAQGLNITQLNGNKANNSAGVVLAMGDSWLWGGYDIANTANAVNNNSMERAFGKPIINQGQAGQTSAQIIAKLGNAVAACGGWNNIDLFVLNCGAGEKIQDPAANIAQYNTTLYTNLNTILTEVTGNGVPVVMAAVANISRNDLFANGIPPDEAQFYLTGQYYDDPQYAVIAANYPGVALAENAWSYLMNNPDPYLGNNGTAFHPSVPVGAQAFIDILAGASTGVAAPAIYAALGNVVNFSSYNQALELGLNYQVNTPHIDFFTSGNSSVSYDTRISATGGTGVAGTGTLTFYTATANITGSAIIGGNANISGNITANAVSLSSITKTGANGVGNIGSSSNYFNTVFAKATSAQYADLAEYYTADHLYESGTVVSFGGSQEVTCSNSDQDPTIAGVVSTDPAYAMNTKQPGNIVLPIALVGRVPCFVQGPVRRGQMMVSAGNGRARAEVNPVMGSVIGKALQDFDGESGTIEVVVGRL
jgi:hypothetical protein